MNDDNITKNEVQEIVSESAGVLMYAEEAAATRTEALLKKIEQDIANLQNSVNVAIGKIDALESKIGESSEKAVVSTLLT